MCSAQSVFISVMHFPSQGSNDADTFTNFLLPSRFTVDHPSDRVIPINALSKLKQTKTDLRSSI